MSNQCEHGQLARQCPLCERDGEIERLRKALEWYADEANWVADPPVVPLTWDDEGKRAREALEGGDGGEHDD